MTAKKNIEEGNSNPLNWQKLTPAELDEVEMKGYTEALDFVFEHDDLCNIAVSGPYSSGKSSVISTYKQKNLTNKKIVHISLSYFSPALDDAGNTVNEPIDELLLERKLLNQIIHQIDPQEIPATEFKVKKETTQSNIIKWATISTLLFIFFFYLSKDDLISWYHKLFDYYPKLSEFYPVFTWGIIPLILFSIVFIVIYSLLNLQNGKSFIRKLKIFENELDINTAEQSDVSYFDKYLDEIIYILHKSKLDAIIFEDIDRYDDNLILNKIRELNYIYNQRYKYNKIKFIYAIKDEIFISKDRAKFFDYIIPIVPVIGSSNALGMIKKIFKEYGNDFTPAYLDNVSLYLDDMRLIKNIFNEYVIYKTKIENDDNQGWFSNEKLLTMVIYKNLFPLDFSRTYLELGQGVVHRIIDSFKYINEELYNKNLEKIKILESEIENLKKEIEARKNDHLEDIDELDALFIKLPQNYIYQINNKEPSNHINLIRHIKSNEFKVKYSYSNGYYSQDLDVSSCFEALKDNDKYQERAKRLDQSKEAYINALEISIEKKENEIYSLKLKKSRVIKDIISKAEKELGKNIDELLKYHLRYFEKNPLFKQIEDEFIELSCSPYFPIIKFFIRQGYIDEYYSDYMSFFHQGGLHKNDTLFLRSLVEHERKNWDFKLYTPALIVNRIKERSELFNEDYILNFSLLNYLLEQNHSLSKNILNLILRLQSIDFIEQYIQYNIGLLNTELTESEHINKESVVYRLIQLVKQLNLQDPQLWLNIKNNRDLFLCITFIVSDINTIKLMNKMNRLTKYLNDPKKVLKFDDVLIRYFDITQEQQLTQIAQVFNELCIKVEDLRLSDKELQQYLKKEKLYALTVTNIDYILQDEYGYQDFQTCRFEKIERLPHDNDFYVYLHENIDIAASNIIDSAFMISDDSLAESDYFTDNEETV